MLLRLFRMAHEQAAQQRPEQTDRGPQAPRGSSGHSGGSGTTMATRAGAYAVVVEDGKILLSRWVPRNPAMQPSWTLPGGGMEAREQPEDTAVREVFEETGYTVELQELLGVSSFYIDAERRLTPGDGLLHAVRVVYRARVTGGSLTPEVDGSSDDARWIPIADLHQYPHLDLVEVGLTMAGLEVNA